jgi:starch synthase
VTAAPARAQGYAWEVCTAEGGWGLHHVLQGRKRVLDGITNGVDTAEWDPATDAHTPAAFDAGDTAGKAACKAALQAELGFEVDARVRPAWGFLLFFSPKQSTERWTANLASL